MAHEIIEFGRSSRRFNMGDVAIAFALVSHLGTEWLSESSRNDPKLVSLLGDWLGKLRTTWAFFDPELDKYTGRDRDKQQALLDLMDNCLAGLSRFGQYIPAPFLNGLLSLRGQGALLSDYESSRAYVTIQEIRELIAGENLDA